MRKTKYHKRNRLLEDDWYCGTEKEAIETGLEILSGDYRTNQPEAGQRPAIGWIDLLALFL